jgi:Flp pilus assembly protein TadD
LAAARSGRALDPDDGRLLMAEGIALAELDRLPEAVTRLRAATTRLPPSQRHRAANNLAVVYQRLGDDGAAEIRFREAIAASPTDARYHRNLAELLEHRGRRAEARASYRRALELAPEDRAARAAVEHLP